MTSKLSDIKIISKEKERTLQVRLHLPSVADTDPSNGLQIPNDSNESYNPKSQHWEEGHAGRTLTGLK